MKNSEILMRYYKCNDFHPIWLFKNLPHNHFIVAFKLDSYSVFLLLFVWIFISWMISTLIIWFTFAESCHMDAKCKILDAIGIDRKTDTELNVILPENEISTDIISQ